MPAKKAVKHSSEEIFIQTALDADESELEVGDYVTIRLKVTRIRPIMGIESGVEERQDLELGRVVAINHNHPDPNMPKEYIHHFLVCDSKFCNKCE